MNFFKSLLSPDFMPHGYCYLWDPRMVWLHVIADGLITLSYYCIPVILIYFIRKNRDLPFNRIFWMFGTFILACGTTHLMEIWNVWHSSYLLAGVVKGITAVVSVITAAMLIPLVPRVISLPGRMHLQDVNRKLEEEVAERKWAEEVRGRLSAVVESSDDAIISKTLDGAITSWNRGAERVFGYSSAEALGKSMRILLPPERLNEESDILGRIVRGESVDHFETVRLRKDGKKIDVSVTISPIKDRSGTIVGASKIARDITEYKRGEQALKKSLATSEAALQELADQKFALDQHAIVAVTDVQGTITYVNEKFCTISQYTEDELIGQNHRILNSGHHPIEFFQQMYRTIAAGRVWHGEIKNRAKDGSTYWVDTTIVPTLSTEGKPRQYVAIRADITERKRAEDTAKENLATSQAALKELADQRFAFDQHADVTMADTEGRITYANDKFCSISQYSRKELIGQNHRILNSGHHPKEFFHEMYQTIAKGLAWHGEIKNRAKDSSTYWSDATIVPFMGADGKPRQYIALRSDITKRKLAEQEIQKLNDELERRVVERTAQLETANKELEAFSYSVSHDLRAPLRHIGGFSKLLVEEFGPTLNPTAQHYLDRIQSGTQKMGLLVDELLNLARVGRHALNRQATGLNAIVAEVVAILQPETAGRQVDWAIADLPFVECDPVLTKQVFQNLLANALKFTRPRVSLDARAPAETPAPRRSLIEVSYTEDDGLPVFMVRDNGIGFDMKYVDKLFGVFQRLHRAEDFEGTGIGLATVQRIVQKHGGRVWAEGELDKGATFYFTLAAEKRIESKSTGATAGGQS